MVPTEIMRRIARLAQRTLDPRGPVRPPTAEPKTPQAPRPAVFDKYSAPGQLSDLGILLMPLAGYHGRELGAIGEALNQLGHRVSFLVEEDAVEAIDSYLGDHPRVLAARGYDPAALGDFDAFVAMNDWGEPSRAVYHLARTRGVPSIAKVEGVQDFADVDTGRIRLPYLAADHVLVQGDNDIASLDRKNLHVVGNSNLELAWKAGPSVEPRNGQVVVNSNFTYGVLTEARQQFLTEAVAAILENDLEPVISQHPADLALQGELAYYRAEQSMTEMLSSCEAVITRFSTVPFEAIASGTPFVYFNPHHEKVSTFATPNPAFDHVHTTSDLVQAIDRCIAQRDDFRSRAEPYFRAQVDMTDTRSAERSAQAIAAIAYPS